MEQPSCKTAQPQEASSRGQLRSHSSPTASQPPVPAPELYHALQTPRAHPPQQTGSREITHHISLWGGSQGYHGAPREVGPQGMLHAQHLDRDTLKASGLLRPMFLEFFIL